MKKLTSYFINGILIFVPVAATIGLVKWTLDFVGSMMPFESEGIGLLVLLLLIFFTGFVASNYLGKKLFELVDRLMTKMPVIKLLYSALKDLVQAFAGNKKSFEQPVLVELLENGAKALGFITRNDVGDLGATGHVAVYLPQSYNFAGQVLIFPAEKVHPISLSSSEVMATVVSGGVSGADETAEISCLALIVKLSGCNF